MEHAEPRSIGAINATLEVLAGELGRIEAERNEVLSAKYALERVRAKMKAGRPTEQEEGDREE